MCLVNSNAKIIYEIHYFGADSFGGEHTTANLIVVTSLDFVWRCESSVSIFVSVFPKTSWFSVLTSERPNLVTHSKQTR